MKDQTVDIQHGTSGGFDVLVNGDHYTHALYKDDAMTDAIVACGTARNVLIRDYTRGDPDHYWWKRPQGSKWFRARKGTRPPCN